MLTVLDFLQVFVALHFGIKQAVFVDVFLILDLVLIAQLCKRRLMLFVQLFHRSLVFLLGDNFFLLAAFYDTLIILAVVVRFQVVFRISNQFVDLRFVFGLHRFGLFQTVIQLALAGGLFLRRIDAVTFQVIQVALDADNFIRTIHAQLIDLRLDFADVIIDRLAELQFLLRSKNCCICHKLFPHSQVFRAQSQKLFLICLFCVDNSGKMSVGHDPDAVGDAKDLRHFRGNDDHRFALFCHLNDQFIDLILRTNVNTARGFVHHEYLRLTLQPFAKNDFLLVAARQAGNHIVRAHALGVHDLDLLAGGFDHLGLGKRDPVLILIQIGDRGIES